MQERLLKRVRRWNNEEDSSIKQLDAQDYIESVRFDVEQLLNTRQGTVLINSDMGMPELTHLFNGFSMPEVERLQVNMAQQLKLFEPRLSMIKIEFTGDQSKVMQLSFMMTAQLQQEQQMLAFSVKIKLSENGSVSVTS